MARATMAGVIRKLREMVGDDEPDPAYSDDSLEDTLDTYQSVYRILPLTLVTARFAPVGSVREFQVPAGAWEDGTLFYGANRQAIVPTAFNGRTGIVAFDVSGGVPAPQVAYVSGATYCLFSAAAEVCDKWAAKLARAFDTASNDQTMKRSQMATSLRAQAQTFRAQIPIRSVSMSRSDVF